MMFLNDLLRFIIFTYVNNSFQNKTILMKSFQNNGIDLTFHSRQEKKRIYISKIDIEEFKCYRGNKICIKDLLYSRML